MPLSVALRSDEPELARRIFDGRLQIIGVGRLLATNVWVVLVARTCPLSWVMREVSASLSPVSQKNTTTAAGSRTRVSLPLLYRPFSRDDVAVSIPPVVHALLSVSDDLW